MVRYVRNPPNASVDKYVVLYLHSTFSLLQYLHTLRSPIVDFHVLRLDMSLERYYGDDSKRSLNGIGTY